MNKFFSLIILSFLLFTVNQGCTNFIESKEPEKFSLVVSASNLMVKIEPGIESAEVGVLREGNLVEFADSVSSLVSTMKMGDKVYTQPWLRIRSADMEGWVFGGGLSYDDSLHSVLLDKMDQKVLAYYFGDTLASNIAMLSMKLKSAKTDKMVANCFLESSKLRDELVRKLELAGNKDNFSEIELSPLKQKLGFLIPEFVAGGASIFLFQDYGYWTGLSRKSAGKEDNHFFEMINKVYPDSIEGFYPDWFMQTSANGGCSKLGQGVHTRLLQQLEKALELSPLFSYAIVDLKKALIRDVLESTHFSETQEKAKAELVQLLNSPSKLITQEDKVALEVRLTQFQKGSSLVRFESFGEE